MGLIEDENVVKTLVSHRPDPPFSIGIRIGRLQGRQDNFTAFGFEDLVERLGEFRISIMDQVAKLRALLLPIPCQVASLLGDAG